MMTIQERRRISRRQIDGLKKRLEADENDYVEFEKRVDEVQVWCWLNERKIYITGDDGLTHLQVLRLVTVLKEADEFLTYGPGQWVGDGDDRRWESALDEDGNDRVIPED